jgi:hypothetical protein
MCVYNRTSMLELGSVRSGFRSSGGCRGNVAFAHYGGVLGVNLSCLQLIIFSACQL